MAGPSTTLFVCGRSTQEGRLLRDDEPPLDFDLPSNIDISQVGVVGGEFATVSDGNGRPSLVAVSPSGRVVSTPIDDTEFNLWQQHVAPGGSCRPVTRSHSER